MDAHKRKMDLNNNRRDLRKTTPGMQISTNIMFSDPYLELIVCIF